MDRRDFLKMIGVASGASVLAGCNLDRKTEQLIPYLVPPEDGVIPGDATYVPSTCTECPANCGMSVTIKEKRPTKLDGLASHPLGDGAMCIRGQASLWRLYDDERIRQPLMRDGDGNLVPTTWTRAYEAIASAMEAGGGADNVFLSGRTTGTISLLIDEYCRRLGVRRLPEFELYAHGAIREANRQLFGQAVVPAYHFTEADFVLTVGADVLDTFGNPVEYSRQIAKARSGHDVHLNWYHAEPHISLTGYRADHRLSVRPGSEGYLLAYLLRELHSRRIFNNRRLESHLSAVPVVDRADAASRTGLSGDQLVKLANDLMDADAPLVVAGGVSTRQEGGVAVARMAALLQYACGMMGKTVDFADALDHSRVGSPADTARLAEQLDAGEVGVLLLAGVDPASRLPRVEAKAFADRMTRAGLTVGIGSQLNETLSSCDVVLPLSHALESWGDAEPRPGLMTVIQPAVEPFHDTRSLGDILLQLLAALGRGPVADNYRDYLFASWRQRFGATAAEELIANGYLNYRPRGGGGSSAVSLSSQTGSYPLPEPPRNNVLLVAPSLRFYDGRSRDIPLLNEIPDPLSSVTWDRWISVSLNMAEEMALKDGDWVSVSAGDWEIELPVMRQPGLQKDVVMIEQDGDVSPTGLIQSSGEVSAVAAGLEVRKIASKGRLSYMAGSKTSETEGYIPLQHIPHHTHDKNLSREDITFYPVPDYPVYRWAMAIDLDKCTGCSACVAACYVENNVPVVGRDQHLKGREMSWLAIQPYYNEDETAEIMPVMCQHCDNAPCEPVCPVYAVYHNDEGLNAQVYNRCVGTRYCSNNCPYKVRRFNWFNYHNQPPPLDQLFNPDVSRRGKGIMEKCSFCVQRIRKARDVAKDEKRQIGADEVIPACAQTCPADAIVFGNIKDENSRVAQMARSQYSHQALEELGTGPGVYYLTRRGNGHEHG
jgi:molybdopterin-containing oxidoreductase family iron-sulfur binding subunit